MATRDQRVYIRARRSPDDRGVILDDRAHAWYDGMGGGRDPRGQARGPRARQVALERLGMATAALAALLFLSGCTATQPAQPLTTTRRPLYAIVDSRISDELLQVSRGTGTIYDLGASSAGQDWREIVKQKAMELAADPRSTREDDFMAFLHHGKVLALDVGYAERESKVRYKMKRRFIRKNNITEFVSFHIHPDQLANYVADFAKTIRYALRIQNVMTPRLKRIIIEAHVDALKVNALGLPSNLAGQDITSLVRYKKAFPGVKSSMVIGNVGSLRGVFDISLTEDYNEFSPVDLHMIYGRYISGSIDFAEFLRQLKAIGVDMRFEPRGEQREFPEAEIRKALEAELDSFLAKKGMEIVD